MRSPQLSRFLKHIVDAKLRGDEANIKAYSIAVDVFGRPPSFDPQTDPIVRVQARRLRGLLQEFYRQKLGRSGTRITLPVGRYIPEFELIADEEVAAPAPEAVESPPAAVEAHNAAAAPLLEPAPAKVRFGRRFWVQAIAAMALIIGLGVLLAGLQALRSPQPVVAAGNIWVPDEPTVYVSFFSNLTDNPDLSTFVSRLNDHIGTLLAQYEDVQVGFITPSVPIEKHEGSFLLSGTVVQASDGIEVKAVLTDVVSGTVVWTQTIPQPMPTKDDDAVPATAARKIMREVGAFRSPVHAAGRRWLDDNSLQLPKVNGYVCLLSYRYARDTASAAAIAKAIDCHERLLAEQPDLPQALAASAWLKGRAIYARVSPDEPLHLALDEATKLAERAVRLAPDSSFTHEQYASVQNLQEHFELAQRHYAIALGFQPLNTDARAGYAVTLQRTGEWDTAAREAQFAIADTPNPPAWYFYLPSLVALRNGQYEQAIRYGRLASPSGELGAIVALAAAGYLDDREAVSEFEPRVLNTESLRRMGVLPWLTIRIKDREVLTRIADGLRASGLPESTLTSQF